MNTRRTQPYRNNGKRHPGHALEAMLKGKPAHMPNPMDHKRRLLSMILRSRRG